MRQGEGTAERLHHVELLRGVAALSVVWFHMTNTWGPGFARESGRHGWLGVEAFFVISGFVIPYSLQKSGYRLEDFWRFLLRRMTRLEPPYLISIALVVCLGVASSHAPGFRGQAFEVSWPQVAWHFLYAIPLSKYPWLNVVYWTLSYEFVFYLLAGLLTPLLMPRGAPFTAAAFAAATGLLRLATGHWDAMPLFFFSGVAVCRYLSGRDGLWALAASLGGAAALQVLMDAPLPALVGLLSALAIAFVRIPANGAVSLLGAISYALYLTHVPVGGRVVNLGRRFGAGPLHDLAVSIAGFIVSLVVAYIFYRLVDLPATRLSRRIGFGSRATGISAIEPA